MTNNRRIINIVIGAVFCGYLEYFFWTVTNVIGVDVSLSELTAQNHGLSSKVMIWRIVTTLVVCLLFGWVVRKNLQPKR